MNPPKPMPQKKPKPGASLLVVDDTPANLQLLAGVFRQNGYQVRLAPSGELAWQSAQRKAPDLILLDINMPGLSGYDFCERLKADPHLAAVPVIFLSARPETVDKVKGFTLGAVDYVTKPFQIEEVLARVRTHLELSGLRRELESRNAHLEELERQRDSLVHMIVHDMTSPIVIIRMALELLQENPAPADGAKLIQDSLKNASRLVEMTQVLLAIHRLEAGQMPIKKEPGDLIRTLRSSLESLTPLAKTRRLHLDSQGPVMADYDADLVSRVTTNLLTNAIKFTPNHGVIKLAAGRHADHVRVTVADNGHGIAPEYHHKIFEKFSQTELRHKQVGTGLGLAFCKLAVTAHGGQIGVESNPGHGSTFWFTLPTGANG